MITELKQKSEFILMFFLGSILLYLPQNSFTIANSDSTISSFNTRQMPIKVLHTDAGETWLLPTGGFVYKTGSESTKRVFDEITNEWKPNVYEDLGNNNYKIKSSNIGTVFNGQTIIHYDTELTEKKAVEKLKFLKAESGNYVEIPLTFVDRTMSILQKPVSETVGSYEVTDTVETIRIIENWNSNEGTIKIYYDFTEGKPLKHTFLITTKNDGIFRLYHVFETSQNIQLESNGVSNSPNTEQIKIDISQNDIKVVKNKQLVKDNTQTIFIKKSGQTDMLRHVTVSDQANSSFMFGELVSPNKGNVAWQKFIGLNIDSSKNSAILEFQYGDWFASAGETFELDPDTFTSNNPTEDGQIFTNQGTGSACPTVSGKETTAGTMSPDIDDSSTATSRCYRAYSEWPTTAIPDSATINDVVFKFQITTVSGPVNCSYMPMSTRPSLAAAQTVWDDIGDGTPYISNNTSCTTIGTNKSIDLGTNADTDLKNLLASDWFAIGIKFTDETRDPISDRYTSFATKENASPTPSPTLEVTYTTGSSPPSSSEKAFTLVSIADLSKQKNNLGTSFIDIYNGAFEPDFNLINFTGYSKVRILSGWDYNLGDTGNHTMRWVDASNNTRVLFQTSSFNVDQDPNNSGWINLPTWAKNETTIEWQGKSTVAADDPIAKYFRIFLR